MVYDLALCPKSEFSLFSNVSKLNILVLVWTSSPQKVYFREKEEREQKKIERKTRRK
jgi:hypothetical protein